MGAHHLADRRDLLFCDLVTAIAQHARAHEERMSEIRSERKHFFDSAYFLPHWCCFLFRIACGQQQLRLVHLKYARGLAFRPTCKPSFRNTFRSEPESLAVIAEHFDRCDT